MSAPARLRSRFALWSFLWALASPAAWPQAPASPDAWKVVLAAAQKEGRVVFYSSTVPAVLNRLKADFEKAYPGIVVEASRNIGLEGMTKLEMERSSGSDGGD